MNEMQRICGEKWLSMAQVKWDELKHKIIGQADLEASHKTKLKEVLEGVQKNGMICIFYKHFKHCFTIKLLSM